ncbi:hypothetical protein PGQ11_004297 [Apiospora arundinis]|uniref:Uncharacterized protein n=1 Tax=Apiospora arundinis TaxID=335852 RepID=A0ABR2J873_9PEZI
MERQVSRRSSGIKVDREIVVHTSDRGRSRDGRLIAFPRSLISIIWSMSGQAQHGTKPEPRRADTPPVRLSRSGGRAGGQFRELLGETSRENDLLDMLEFLRRTPPPDNYMSVPDNFSISSSEDEKWKSKFKVFRSKRKSRRKRRKAPIIRLPDTAVAGQTTGGHRHIAISIPLEYTHFGPDPPTQYPVFDTSGLDLVREIEARFGPIRTSTGERGTVTVLRPVEEDRESFMSEPTSQSHNSSIPQDRLSALHAPPPPRQGNVPAPSAQQGSSVKDFGRSKHTPSSSKDEKAYVGEEEKLDSGEPAYGLSPFGRAEKKPGSRSASPQSPFEGPSTGQIIQVGGPFAGPVAGPIAGTQARFNFPPPPPRGSSKKGKQRADLTRPIDDILGPLSPFIPSMGGNHSPSKSRVYSARGSVAESIGSLGSLGSEPKVYDAQTAQAYSSIPIVVRPPSQRTTDRLSGVPPGADRPVHGDDPVQPMAEGSVQSRRDRVRMKKQKDLTGATSSLAPGSSGISPESPVLGRLQKAESSGDSKESPSVGRTSSDIPATQPVVPTVLKDPAGTTAVAGNLARAEKPLGEGPSPPTTDHSSTSSQLSFVTGSDRISLHRRRERRTQREQARRAREVAQASSEQLSQQRQTPQVPERPSPERDLLRRYDDLREQRHRDMEKRLRRLERNGDVWLQTLLPLMEGISRLLQELYLHQRSVNSRLSFTEAEGAAPPATTSEGQATERAFSPREEQFYQSLPFRMQTTRSHDVPLQRVRPSSAVMATMPASIAEYEQQAAQTSRRRPHSIQIPNPAPSSTAPGAPGAGGSGSRGSSGGTPLTARRVSPLQAEFERELAARRAREVRDEELDARIAELEEQQRRYQRERQQRRQGRVYPPDRGDEEEPVLVGRGDSSSRNSSSSTDERERQALLDEEALISGLHSSSRRRVPRREQQHSEGARRREVEEEDARFALF